MDAALALVAQLEAARIERGISRRDLAYAAGIGPATAETVLTTGRAHLQTILAIAHVLGLELYAVTPLQGAQYRPCGTLSAARRHYARGEPLDALCRGEQRRYDRERKRLLYAARRGAQEAA